MDELKLFLNNIHKVSDSALDNYLSHWSEYSLPKKTIITESGKTERFLYFVLEGVQKSYYLNDGRQHVMFFGYTPSFCGVMESFFTLKPSRYFLETITDSQFLRISYTEHNQLVAQYREIETLFRKTSEMLLSGLIERHHELLTFNAEDRLKKFTTRSPHLLNLVSQKDLASYLGMDATNFSKMINKIRI